MHTRTFRLSLLAALLAFAMLGAPSVASASRGCAHANLVPNGKNLKKVGRATVCLVNVERKRRGRRTLRTSRQLYRAARLFSVEMVTKRFFAHVGPGGSTLKTRVRDDTSYLRGRRRWALGENLGWGSGKLSTPRRTVRNWMNSRGHRATVLDRRYRHIGVGVTTGSPISLSGRTAATYAAEFGSRGKRRR